jgi:hypothetical protein
MEQVHRLFRRARQPPPSPREEVVVIARFSVHSPVVLAFILGLAGCSLNSVRGGGALEPPAVPGSGPRTGGRVPPVHETCRVGVANQTHVALNVTYVTTSPNGGRRTGRLGRIEINASKSMNVVCGETVTAYGSGPGVDTSGSVVARDFDDSWIRLVATAR